LGRAGDPFQIRPAQQRDIFHPFGQEQLLEWQSFFSFTGLNAYPDWFYLAHILARG
jgi:hypothetical protein